MKRHIKLPSLLVFMALVIVSGCSTLQTSYPKLGPFGDTIDSMGTVKTTGTFTMESGGSQQLLSWGGGVHIGSGYVVTLNHVIGLVPPKAQIFTPLGLQTIPLEGEITDVAYTFVSSTGEVKLEKVWSDEELDIVLLRSPDLTTPPARLGNSDNVEVGTVVFVVSVFGSEVTSIREGLVSSTEMKGVEGLTREPLKNYFVVSAGIYEGDSGAPVVSLRRGKPEVIGLVQGVYVGAPLVGWAMDINFIMETLERVEGLTSNLSK